MIRQAALLSLAILAALTAARAQTATAPATQPSSASAPAATTQPVGEFDVVRLDNPRDTLTTFLAAMSDYRRSLEIDPDTADPQQAEQRRRLASRLDKAVECLDLSNMEADAPPEVGRIRARQLKEYIDRRIDVDPFLIPIDPAEPTWRLAETELRINQVEEGPRRGQWLISAETVAKAPELFAEHRDEPYVVAELPGAGYDPPRISTAAMSAAESLLMPVRTETAYDSLHGFIEAMNDYRLGLESGDPALLARLDDAVRYLDLSAQPDMVRQQVGREAAIYLKEVLDRLALIDEDYEALPQNENLWTLGETDIAIARVQSGDRQGQWLFTPATVSRAPAYYEKVRHLPYVEGTGRGAGYIEPWLQRHMPVWANRQVFALAGWQWIGIFLAIVLGLAMRLVVGALGKLALVITRKTRPTWDELVVEAVINPVSLLAAVGIWFAALHLIRLRDLSLTIMTVVLQVILYAGIIWLLYRLTGVISVVLKERYARGHNQLDDQLVKLISSSLKIFIVVFGVLLGAQNLGVNVFSVLAGLGIGGLAVALAAKDTLANFFGSVTIMLDRPFQVGHWVIVGSSEGTVEEIGFRTTKIRTFYNSLITIPNAIVATTHIDNMGLRRYRRVTTTIGVTYDTPPEKMEAFLEGIKNIIKANPHTRKDFFHVVFNDFGSSSLNILLYFFLKVPDWSTELVERQNVLLSVVRLAKQVGVDFAFPTQTMHVESFPEKQPFVRHEAVSDDQLAAVAATFAPDGNQSKPGGLGIYTPAFKEPPAS